MKSTHHIRNYFDHYFIGAFLQQLPDAFLKYRMNQFWRNFIERH